MAKKIILDVDTGSDDAVAIMAAILDPQIDLVAVCTVAGNNPIENTTDNSLRVVTALGGGVPVYRGCAKPLAKFLAPWRANFSFDDYVAPLDEDGNVINAHPDVLDFPKSSAQPQEAPAAAFYVDYLRKAEQPVTIVAVGPLTNIAAALIIDPSIVKNIEGIYIMGGGHNISNQSVFAEFNIWYDPEAAQHVVHCGVKKIVIVPLDATYGTPFTMDDVSELRAKRRYACDKTADLIELRIKEINALIPDNPPNFTELHDPLALYAAVDEGVLEGVRRVHLDIGLSDYGEGATIINRSKRLFNGAEDRNVYFAMGSNPVRFKQLLLGSLSRSAPV